MKKSIFIFLLLLSLTQLCHAADQPLLFQEPTLSKTHIAFAFAGDLWIVGRNGGRANRLTTGAGVESDPYFSPDGSSIAFTGQYDGNIDVFVVSSNGGVPRRLTYHPGPDISVGWTPDGSRILFKSTRNSARDTDTLFTVTPAGGFPDELPLPRADFGSFSPDAQRLAYVPLFQWQPAWKRYRGGQTKPIWIANLKDSSVESIPRENSNDFNPMWIGNSIYFLSDRNGPVALFRYDLSSKQIQQVLENDGFDFKSANAGPDGIVYEQFGSVNLFDFATNNSKRIAISLEGDLPEVRPHFQKVTSKSLYDASLSPSGARAVFQARGEIITVPAEKGDIRNLTRTPSIMERDPAWSPDGKLLAHFSDESGEYALHIRNQNGLGEVRKINLGNPPSFFYKPRWSPDSKKIVYTDKRLNVWYVELEKQKPVKVDTDYYESYIRELDPVWSPDSKWLSYAKFLRNHLHAIFIYSLESGKSHQITDGLSDALYPQFDDNGKYLYFAASTDIALSVAWLDLSSVERPVTRTVYAVVLDKTQPSPVTPESDEEKGKEEKKEKEKDKEGEKEKKTPVVRIDVENIGQRIVSLPIPARNYIAMAAGKEGNLFVLEGSPVLLSIATASPSMTAYKFDLSTRKTEKYLEGLSEFSVSDNGEKMLYSKSEKWFLAPTEKVPTPEKEKELNLETLEIYVQPKEEWAQMYHEAWRVVRDFFYDPGYHGLDLNAAEKEYARFLPNLASRGDLNYLFVEMLGELTAGHVFVEGGETPEIKQVKVGLLGADYKIENGKYRFARIYNGENWNPELRAPLTQPGVNVNEGEYLLTVNGQNVDASKEIYSYFEGTAGKSTVLQVSNDPQGKGREVTVVPVDSETNLRYLAWIEGNRRKVDELSGGRIAYVHLPDTYGGGFSNFNRYYFAQVGKEGAVIDERFNHGGDIADYIIDYLHRPVMSMMMTREGAEMASPFSSIYGPKAMIINEMSGSGGDAMPWYFRKAGIGPLIGKKTWGGLIGIYDYPPLMDGGIITAPRIAIYGLNGEWEVENVGIAPDIEIENDPKQVRQGHDPQLEKAVEVVMEMLKKNPLPKYKRPPYPNYNQTVGKNK